MSFFCGQKLRQTDTGFTGFSVDQKLRAVDVSTALIAGTPLKASQA
jgi:hypothetical protein